MAAELSPVVGAVIADKLPNTAGGGGETAENLSQFTAFAYKPCVMSQFTYGRLNDAPTVLNINLLALLLSRDT